MKKSGREKRAEISLALFMFLVFCLFISAFDSSQPRDVDKMSDPPAVYFCLYLSCFPFFPFFPLCFLVISSLFLLLSILCYSVLLFSLYIYIYFSMFASHDLSVIFYYCLPLFFFLCPFHFVFICILYFLQILSLISVYYAFSFCFCYCF